MAELSFQVDGMDCTGCSQSIQRSVSRVPGVEQVTADHVSGKVQVVLAGEADEATIRAAIEDAGFEIVGAAG